VSTEASGADPERPRVLKLRYAAVCAGCGASLPPKSEAVWDKGARTATCVPCHAPARKPLERGRAGVSARRRYDKLHDAREQQSRDRFGRLSAVHLALTVDPQSTHAWGVGSAGERRLGAYLETLHDDSSIVILHDRRIPGSRANIDHIAITRSGVYAIDAKNYTGKVQRVDKGGWLSTDFHLYVDGRDRTKLVAGMSRQLEAIRAAVGQPLFEEFALMVTGILCFVDAEWPLFAKPLQLGGVWVEWSKSLGERLQRPGPLAPEHVGLLAQRIAQSLPPA
jgi:hypothetical protein